MTDKIEPPPPKQTTYRCRLDEEGRPIAFYPNDIWTDPEKIPAGSVDITAEQYRELVDKQPWSRLIKGKVVIVPEKDRPKPQPLEKSPLEKIMESLDDINKRLKDLEGKS